MKKLYCVNAKKFSVTKKIKKLYCVICGKYRKSEKSKISWISSFNYLQ